MALMLHIDTAIETASVCLGKDGSVLQLTENQNPKNDSAWLHGAIRKMMEQQQCKFSDLDAVAVSIGPGSYTGLRMGLSAAKGFCYALQKPLITIGTLNMMAHAAKEEPFDLLGPMIDARRQEVFTALYDKQLNPVLPPQAMIIHNKSFEKYLSENKILFFGNGSKKVQPVIQHVNACFKPITVNASNLVALAEKHFSLQLFSPVAYTEPLYLKEFHSASRNISSS
jgi:tRNA threonylcarbamoyladenosine biosynthesis protein TsaB